MATPFTETPKWFNAQYYFDQKLAALQKDNPKMTDADMKKAFREAGFDNPYDHYLANGDAEGLAPNPLFNSAEYLATKVEQLGSAWTAEMVAKTIHDANMTIAQHYETYGYKEGLNPSSSFSNEKYLQAKCEQLLASDPKGEWTVDKVAASFAENGITPMAHYYTYGKGEGLWDAKFDYSVNGKPIPRPGITAELTTGADIVTPDAKEAAFRTSDRDDTINAVVNSVSTKTTLNAADVIDGGTGNDVLNVELGANFNGFKTGGVKNVETINLTKASGRTFDATGVEKAGQYVVDGGTTGTVTIKNVDTTATEFALKQEAGSFTVQFADAALAGSDDAATVVLNGVGVDAANRVAVSARGMSSGKVETLVLESAAKTSNFVSTDGYDTVAVAGAGNTNVMVNSAAVKTFDASAATGKVTANLSSSSAALRTVNGGAGDDTITVSTGLAASAVLNGGDGNDTLSFAGYTGGIAVSSTINGFETLQFVNSAGTPAVSVNMNKVSDVTTFKLNGEGAFDDTVTITGAKDKGSHTLEIDNHLTNTGTGDFTYDGNAVLTVNHVGDGTTNTTIGDINAASVAQLDISNLAASGSLTISDLNIVKATSLNVHTGDYGVEVNNTTTGMAALKSVSLDGNSLANVTLATDATKLETVDARGLNGNLSFSLSGATDKAVSIYGTNNGTNTINGFQTGNDNVILSGSADATFRGGAGLDKIVLGDGAYKIDVTGYAGTNADHAEIKNFNSNDVLDVTTATGFKGASTAITTAVGESVFAWTATTPVTITNLYSSATGANTAHAAIKAAITDTSTGGVLTDATIVFNIGDGKLAVYEFDITAATNTITDGQITGIKCVGVVEGIAIGDLAEANFA